jgi:hypothetical protein
MTLKRLLATQLGYRPVCRAIQEPDIQLRLPSAASRPSRSFEGAGPSLECRRSANWSSSYSDVCRGVRPDVVIHLRVVDAVGQPHLKTDVMIDRISNCYRHGAVGASASSSSLVLLSKVERRPKLG